MSNKEYVSATAFRELCVKHGIRAFQHATPGDLAELAEELGYTTGGLYTICRRSNARRSRGWRVSCASEPYEAGRFWPARLSTTSSSRTIRVGPCSPRTRWS